MKPEIKKLLILNAPYLLFVDSGHFADILAAASSNANTNVAMMGETFKYCAPVAGALGFTAEDTAEAIGLMANAGIKSSQAGTAMRSMMTNLTGEVKFTGDAFGELTVQTTNTDGSMRSLGDILTDCRAAFAQMSESEKAANAEALVGKNAMSGFLAVMNAAPGDIEKLNSAINSCDGTAEEMAATMQDNLAGQLTILKSQLEELAISIGEILMPYIRQIVGWIQGLVDWLNSLDEGTKKIIVTVALVAAALGPVLIVIGKVVGAIGTIMTVVPKIAGAISSVIAFVSGTVIPAISAVVAAIGWVPLAIAAVVAILVVLYNKCGWFRDAVNAIWTQIREFFVSAWQAICSFFTETIPNAWNSLVAFFQGIPEWWSGLWQSVGDFFSGIWTDMMNNPILTGIVDMIRSLWENLSTTLQGVWQGIQTAASGAWELMGYTMDGFRRAVRTAMAGGSSGADGYTRIMGRAEATAEQMRAYLKAKNPEAAQPVLDMVPLYLSEGEAEGVRGDIAFAQSCLETGNFGFSGSAVTLQQNNFCGMGVTGKGVKGNSFDTPLLGIRAQVQHLKAYASREKLRNVCIDPRFKYVVRGCAEYVEWLGQKENPDGRGWAARAGYGEKILHILEGILGMTGEGVFRPYLVRVSIPDLNIRKGPGTDYGKTGKYMGNGIFTIVEEADGKGASRWGKLKSGAGWISLDFCESV